MKILQSSATTILLKIQQLATQNRYCLNEETDCKQFKQMLRQMISFRWPILTLLILTTACVDRETLFKEIVQFDQSVQTGTQAISAYYNSLNEQQLKLYLMVLELNPNCEVGDEVDYKCLDPNWRSRGETPPPSPLAKLPIPLESIQARMSLLQELAAYSKSLAALAGDDSPEKFKGNI